MYKKKYVMRIDKFGVFVPEIDFNDDTVDAEDLKLVSEVKELVDNNDSEIIENKILGKVEYEGDSNITTSQINKIVPIGKIYGKIQEVTNFKNDDFINNVFPNKGKILRIQDKDTFDSFTDMYGYVKKKLLLIKWKTVEKDFRGIIIDSLVDDRVNNATFKGEVYTSWVINEYKYIDTVIIFIKQEQVQYEKQISFPFKGYIMDHYAIDDQTYVSISDKVTHDKIVVIDNIKHFDQFTTKYGDGKKIDWVSVNKDYIGFYIVDDIELSKNRRKKCFHNGKLVNSWWSGYKLKSGLVYMFR